MPDIKDWSTTPGDNNSSAPNGWPEGMNAAVVNNTARQRDADVRGFAEALPWFNYGHTCTQASSTSFTIAVDVTSIYTQYRILKIEDSSTLYAYVTSSSFSSPNTTVNVETLDGSSLSTSMNGQTVSVAIMPTSNFPVNKNLLYQLPIYAASSGSTDAYAITLTPSPVSLETGMIVRFKADSANTGAATLNVNSIGAKTIKKNSNADLDANDIKNNQFVTVQYDGTNWQMMSPFANPVGLPVDDTSSIVQDPSDNTKQVRIDAGSITSGNTRVITMADSNVDLGDLASKPNITQGTKSTEFSTTSTSFVDVSLSTSITPDDTTDGVKITTSFSASMNGQDGNQGYFRILRDSTDITGTIPLTIDHDQGRAKQLHSFNFVDEPSTESATTYKVQAKTSGNSTLFMFDDNSLGTIICERVQGGLS